MVLVVRRRRSYSAYLSAYSPLLCCLRQSERIQGTRAGVVSRIVLLLHSFAAFSVLFSRHRRRPKAGADVLTTCPTYRAILVRS